MYDNTDMYVRLITLTYNMYVHVRMITLTCMLVRMLNESSLENKIPSKQATRHIYFFHLTSKESLSLTLPTAAVAVFKKPFHIQTKTYCIFYKANFLQFKTLIELTATQTRYS